MKSINVVRKAVGQPLPTWKWNCELQINNKWIYIYPEALSFDEEVYNKEIKISNIQSVSVAVGKKIPTKLTMTIYNSSTTFNLDNFINSLLLNKERQTSEQIKIKIQQCDMAGVVLNDWVYLIEYGGGLKKDLQQDAIFEKLTLTFNILGVF